MTTDGAVTSSLARATALVRDGAGHRADVPSDWAQGRAVFGGLAAAICAQALQADAPPGHRLVRITTAFVSALAPGPARVVTEVVRAGRNVSSMRATLTNLGAEQPAATCLATLARPRPASGLAHDGLVMPVVPPPDEVPDGPVEHYYPAFARHFAFRQCLGPRPFSGAKDAAVGGWCRLRQEGPLDAALVCALADAWPPAAVARARRWCHVASLEMTVHFLDPLLSDAPAGWLLFDARADHLAGGLCDEHAVLYRAGGAPLATVQQLISLLESSEAPPEPAPRPT